MKRVALTILAVMSIGAAINISVAWACSSRPLPWFNPGPTGFGIDDWPEVPPESWPMMTEVADSGQVAGKRLIVIVSPSAPNGRRTHQMSATDVGWPLFSIRRIRYQGGGYSDIDDERDTYIKVIPSGFAANTTIYATAAYLIALAPFTARRALRRRRGSCVKCGYNLHDIDGPCPECGTER